MQSTTSLILIFHLLCALASAAEQNKNEAEAIKSAEVFLQLIDCGQYWASWGKTAPIFNGQVSREKWVEMLSGARPLFGAMTSRDVRAARFTTSLPGAPDGDYVTIQFASSFERKAAASETVTMTLIKNEWQVAGYFIK
jgi:hypothetical protein